MNKRRYNLKFNKRKFIVNLEAELEVTSEGFIEGIEDEAKEIPIGIRLKDGGVLVPMLAFQDLNTGQIYWTDDALEAKAGAVLNAVKESIVIPTPYC